MSTPLSFYSSLDWGKSLSQPPGIPEGLGPSCYPPPVTEGPWKPPHHPSCPLRLLPLLCPISVSGLLYCERPGPLEPGLPGEAIQVAKGHSAPQSHALKETALPPARPQPAPGQGALLAVPLLRASPATSKSSPSPRKPEAAVQYFKKKKKLKYVNK